MARQSSSPKKKRGKKPSGSATPSKTLSAAGATAQTEADAPVKRKTNPAEFVREVRQEAAKITWPSRKETTVTTIMVFIMVSLAAVFFFVVDQILGTAVRFLLGLGA